MLSPCFISSLLSGRLTGNQTAVQRAVTDQQPEVVDEAASHQHFKGGLLIALPQVDANFEEMRADGLSRPENAGVKIHRTALGQYVTDLGPRHTDLKVSAADIGHGAVLG